MSRILRISQNDYRIRVQSGGSITLDTGVDSGTVFVTGDLVVQGNTTTINTANMTIEDNIILLNKGELGQGVTEGTSGIEIDRGFYVGGPFNGDPYPRAQFIFDENVTHYNPLITANVDGTFVLKLNDNTLTGLQTNSITTNGLTNLVFDLQGGDNVIRIANNDATAYSNRLLADVFASPEHDNDIPNRLFITSYISSGLVQPGTADVDRIYKGHGFPVVVDTEILATSSSLLFYVGVPAAGTKRAEITSAGLFVDNIHVANNTITTTVNNLILDAYDNNVEVDAFLNLSKQATPPGVDGSGTLTKVYTNTTPISTPTPNYTPGQTGIYFTNTLNTDEIIAKKRALLFSMIF